MEYEESIKNLYQAIKLSPDNDDYINNIGITLETLKKYEEASE